MTLRCGSCLPNCSTPGDYLKRRALRLSLRFVPSRLRRALRKQGHQIRNAASPGSRPSRMHEPGLDGWILGLRQDEHAAWKGKGHIAQFVSSSLFRSHQTVAMSASITDKEAETGCAKPEKQRHATIEYRPGACSNTLMASARSDQPPNMPAPLGPASSSASTATRNYRRRSGAIIDITSSDWRGWVKITLILLLTSSMVNSTASWYSRNNSPITAILPL